MKLSIVATLYQSSSHIHEFCERMSLVASEMADDDYEIVLVNDGSPDNSLEIALDISRSNRKMIVVDLSRNFGHHKAMMTGLAHARGDKVFLIDSDLEEQPEWLPDFAADMTDEKCDVVFGIQERRKGGLFERFSGHLFYSLFNMVSGLSIPENVVTARLMTRNYVDALLLHDEREIFIAGLWHITGFRQCPRVVEKQDTSTSTYTLRRKMSMFINSITSFSNAPLIGIFYIGVFILLLSGAYTGSLVINWLFYSRPVSGWTSVMASIWLLGGLTISLIGVVGIYLAKVFTETKRRPYTIIKNVYTGAESAGEQRDV